MPPLRFLLIATSLVGLLQFYIGIRLVPDLPGHAWIHSLLCMALVLSTLLQPLGLALRGLHNKHLLDLRWIEMTAMGVFSSLLAFTALRDLFLLGSMVADLPSAPPLTRPTDSEKSQLKILLPA